MNRSEIVRWEAHADSIEMKVWLYDDARVFKSAGVLHIEHSQVVAFAAAMLAEQQRSEQYQLEFDQ